jgi:hypothetical protein
MPLATLVPLLWGMAYLVLVLVLTRRARRVPRHRSEQAPAACVRDAA